MNKFGKRLFLLLSKKVYHTVLGAVIQTSRFQLTVTHEPISGSRTLYCLSRVRKVARFFLVRTAVFGWYLEFIA